MRASYPIWFSNQPQTPVQRARQLASELLKHSGTTPPPCLHARTTVNTKCATAPRYLDLQLAHTALSARPTQCMPPADSSVSNPNPLHTQHTEPLPHAFSLACQPTITHAYPPFTLSSFHFSSSAPILAASSPSASSHDGRAEVRAGLLILARSWHSYPRGACG